MISKPKTEDYTKSEEIRQKGCQSFKSTDYKKALEFYNEALKCCPQNEAILSNICATFVNMGKMEEALNEIRKALVLNPNSAKILMRKSTILRYFQSYFRAKECLEKALESCTNSEEEYKHQIRRLIKEMDYLIEKRKKKRDDENSKKSPERRVPNPHFNWNDDDDEYFTDEEVGNTQTQNLFNQMQEQFLTPHPITKLWKPRADALEKRMKADFQFVKENLFGKSYIIRIKMKWITPEIYRTIKVPSNIKLDVLHDKVICPSMGWLRNYHAYFFQSLPAALVIRDNTNLHRFDWGPVFGPLRSAAVDYTCHRTTNGLYIIDASAYSLAQVLQNVGDRLAYVYDYGDMHQHEIILEQILTTDVDSIQLIQGENGCPPEDGQGNYTYSTKLMILDEVEKNPGKKTCPSKKYRELFASCQNACNYDGSRMPFIPFTPYGFDLNTHRQLLERALMSKDSPMDGTHMHTTHFPNGMSSGTGYKSGAPDYDKMAEFLKAGGKYATGVKPGGPFQFGATSFFGKK